MVRMHHKHTHHVPRFIAIEPGLLAAQGKHATSANDEAEDADEHGCPDGNT